jgi:outer membrane immunogenic protein
MKRILLDSVGLVALGLSAPASAADLAARPYTKAPPPVVAAVYDWSGFYIGVNGGGGSSHKSWDFIDPATGLLVAEGSHDATGGTAGGQIGYRWQTAGWVFGLEAQGNWADFKGSNISLSQVSALTGTPTQNRSPIDAFGLFTGQIGYAWNNVLLYVRGGGAVVGDKYDIFDTPTGALLASARETRWGGYRRCRSGVRICIELVVRRRVRPPVHGQPQHHLYRRLHRPHPPGRRYRPGPAQLSLGRTCHCQVLTSGDLPGTKNAACKRPASCRPFVDRTPMAIPRWPPGRIFRTACCFSVTASSTPKGYRFHQ